jgi:hypothetical protein
MHGSFKAFKHISEKSDRIFLNILFAKNMFMNSANLAYIVTKISRFKNCLISCQKSSPSCFLEYVRGLLIFFENMRKKFPFNSRKTDKNRWFSLQENLHASSLLAGSTTAGNNTGKLRKTYIFVVKPPF